MRCESAVRSDGGRLRVVAHLEQRAGQEIRRQARRLAAIHTQRHRRGFHSPSRRCPRRPRLRTFAEPPERCPISCASAPLSSSSSSSRSSPSVTKSVPSGQQYAQGRSAFSTRTQMGCEAYPGASLRGAAARPTPAHLPFRRPNRPRGLAQSDHAGSARRGCRNQPTHRR